VTNDDPGNLELFPNQAEHARYHGIHRDRRLIERMRAARRSR
jgi:hypothetical protein